VARRAKARKILLQMFPPFQEALGRHLAGRGMQLSKSQKERIKDAFPVAPGAKHVKLSFETIWGIGFSKDQKDFIPDIRLSRQLKSVAILDELPEVGRLDVDGSNYILVPDYMTDERWFKSSGTCALSIDFNYTFDDIKDQVQKLHELWRAHLNISPWKDKNTGRGLKNRIPDLDIANRIELAERDFDILRVWLDEKSLGRVTGWLREQKGEKSINGKPLTGQAKESSSMVLRLLQFIDPLTIAKDWDPKKGWLASK